MRAIVLLFAIILFTACTTGQVTKSLGKPLTCTDSDGGKVYETPGSVQTVSSTKARTINIDKCTPEGLVENYCDAGNFPRKVVVDCDCLKGACI